MGGYEFSPPMPGIAHHLIKGTLEDTTCANGPLFLGGAQCVGQAPPQHGYHPVSPRRSLWKRRAWMRGSMPMASQDRPPTSCLPLWAHGSTRPSQASSACALTWRSRFEKVARQPLQTLLNKLHPLEDVSMCVVENSDGPFTLEALQVVHVHRSCRTTRNSRRHSPADCRGHPRA
jgi:hypothetical protein